MSIRQLEDGVYAGAQPTLSQLEVLSKQGVKAIVNHRPDGEEPGQPASSQLEAEAQRLGMQYVHAPLGGSAPVARSVASTRKALEEFARPLFMFCRSGARSEMAYLHARSGG